MNIVAVMKDTRNQALMQINDEHELLDVLIKNDLVKHTKYISKTTWQTMARTWVSRIEQGIIVNTRYLNCYMYLAPEDVLVLDEPELCSHCGQEIPND